MKFRTKKYQPNPNRFVKVLMNALRTKSADILMKNIPGTKEDAEKLMNAHDSLRDIFITRLRPDAAFIIENAWAYLSEMESWEDAQETTFESNLQLDLFNDEL